MRQQRIIATVITAALLLSGCTSLSLNGPDILTPPKAAGSRAEIQQLLEEDAGGGYTLLYPSSGAYKSGVVLHDLDGDGTDEAVALYTDAAGAPKVLCAAKNGERYRSIGSAALSSANVSSLCFADIDADGRSELLISCDAASAAAQLSAYRADDTLSVLYIAGGYTDFITGDFDGNSADDVLLLLPASVEATAAASLAVYTDGAFSEKSSCEIDPTMLSCAKLSFGQISTGIYGAVIDGILENGMVSTQLLCYDASAHALMNPLFVYSGYSDSVRAYDVTSFDIDEDGIIEFPLCELTAHGKSEDTAAVCPAAHWCEYDPGQMKPVTKCDTLLCEKLGFLLRLTAEQLSTLTARYIDENAVALYPLSYKNDAPVLDKPMLTVKRYEQSSFDSSLTAEAVLYEDSAAVYTCILGEGAPLSVDDIKDSFMLIP